MSSRPQSKGKMFARLPSRLQTLTSEGELEAKPYRDPEKLREVYERTGTIQATAAHFGVSHSTIRTWLVGYNFYDPETDGLNNHAPKLQELTPEEVGLRPIGER